MYISAAPLLAGISSEDPFKTTYQHLTRPSSPRNNNDSSRTNSINSFKQGFNDSISDPNEPEYDPTSHSRDTAPLTRYSGQKVLGKSLLSNLGASLVNKVKKDGP